MGKCHTNPVPPLCLQLHTPNCATRPHKGAHAISRARLEATHLTGPPSPYPRPPSPTPQPPTPHPGTPRCCRRTWRRSTAARTAAGCSTWSCSCASAATTRICSRCAPCRGHAGGARWRTGRGASARGAVQGASAGLGSAWPCTPTRLPPAPRTPPPPQHTHPTHTRSAPAPHSPPAPGRVPGR